MSNTNTSPIMVTVKTVDQTGHSSVVEQIDRAIATAFKTKFTQGKNLNIRGDNGLRPFELKAQRYDDTAALKEDSQRLYDQLVQHKNPVVYLTGALVGGTI